MWNMDNGKNAANAERPSWRILYSSQRIIPQKMVSTLHAANAANLKRNNITDPLLPSLGWSGFLI